MATRSLRGPEPRATRYARRGLLALSVAFGLALAFTALMGFAHTKMGRPLLAMMGRMGLGGGSKRGGCPLGLDAAATPEQRRAARGRFTTAHRGDALAAARPALGFKLDVTSKEEVAEWARTHGIACNPHTRSGHDMDCSDVPGAMLPQAFGGVSVKSLWLDFGARGELVSVIAVRRDESATAIGDAFTAIAADLAREAGPPAKLDGVATPERLASGLLNQESAEFRFADYYAIARATNMADGFVLTEEYRSLRD